MKHVIVPQKLLDELEESREKLYRLFESDKFSILNLTDATNIMWILSHMKFKEYK